MKRKQMIVLVMAVILIICSLYYGNGVKQFADHMSVKYDLDGLSAKQIDLLYDQCENKFSHSLIGMPPKAADKSKNEIEDTSQAEVPYITGWNKTEGSILTNPSLGSKVFVDLFTVYGDMWAVIPRKLMHGSYVEKADKGSCVLSSAAADKLFRNSLVVGCKVTLNQTTYLIKGVLKSKEDIILVQADTEEVFPYLELRYDSHPYAASNTKAFLTEQGLSRYKSFVEGNLYGGIAGLFMGLPILVLGCILLRRYLLNRKDNKQNKSKIQRLVIMLGMFTAALLLLYLLLSFSISFSDDYIPSKVSDFAFWGKKYNEVISDYKGMMQYQTWPKEAMILGNLKKCIITSLAAVGLLMFMGKKDKLSQCLEKI